MDESRNRTLPLHGTMELGEWSRVNRELRHHGLLAVDLTDPNMAGHVSDLVLLSSDSAKNLRHTLLTLMRDCDRRQELIQELIVTNNQLREELKAQTMVSEKYESKTREFKHMLDDSRLKMQEMEDDRVNISTVTFDDEERLKNTKDAAVAKCAQLTKKCDTYQAEVSRLQKKLQQINLEEEKRRKKQEEVLQQLRRKWTKGGMANDNMLTVIDWYEQQVERLRQEIDLAQADGNTSRASVDSMPLEGATGNYKALVKSYERQLRDVKKKAKDCENEKELLKLDLESRPALKDLRDAQARIKKMERTLKRHGLCPSHDGVAARRGLLYSTQLEDLEYLPANQCHKLLKSTCEELGVSDAKDLTAQIQRFTEASEKLPRLEQFAQSVVDIVNSNCTHEDTAMRKTHDVLCDKSLHHIVSLLEDWALQINTNQEIQESIHRLSSQLFPWKQLPHYDNPTTLQMTHVLDSLCGEHLEEPTNGPKNRGGTKEQPTKEMLLAIVEHFQNLFDVPTIAGVYTRMNEIYTKLGEVHNVLKTLRDVIGLETDCKTSVIIEAVVHLSDTSGGGISQQLQRLLEDQDLQSVVRKLEEHDEFFPIFQEILQKLMDTLNVRRIDQVLPAVKALKLLAGS